MNDSVLARNLLSYTTFIKFVIKLYLGKINQGKALD